MIAFNVKEIEENIVNPFLNLIALVEKGMKIMDNLIVHRYQKISRIISLINNLISKLINNLI